MRPLFAAVALLLSALPARGAGAPPLSREAGWLAEYVRIDSSNPPGREAAAAAYLAGLLRHEGLPSSAT